MLGLFVCVGDVVCQPVTDALTISSQIVGSAWNFERGSLEPGPVVLPTRGVGT